MSFSFKGLLISWGIVKKTKTEAPASINTESTYERFYGNKNETSPQVAQFDELDNMETLSTKSIDAVTELNKILYEEVAKINPPISLSELLLKSIEEESKNTEEIPTSDFISNDSDKSFVLYDPEKSIKENLQIRPNSRPHAESHSPKPSISLPTYVHKTKYDYNKPMVVKVTNIKNPQDTQIFISAKQFCEHFGTKQKKLYICLNSKDKILNGNCKLEIIPFMESSKKTNFSVSDIESVKVKKVSSKNIAFDIKIKPKTGIQFIDLDFTVLPTGMEFNDKKNGSCPIITKNPFTDKKRKFVSIAEKNPELVAEWDVLRNGVAASEVPCSIKKEAYWLCQKCGTSYKRRVDNRVRRPELGCTKCFNKT